MTASFATRVWTWCLRLLVVAALCAGPVGLRAQDKPADADAAKSSPDALNMYADAASFQNNGAFDVAAEEWSRFLERFADDPLAPKAQHYLGVCQLQLKQYAKAADAFDKVIARYPKFEQLEETYRNLGWCRYSLAAAGDASQFKLAVAAFSKLATDFPKSKYAEESLFYEAESHYALGDRKAAALSYGRLVTHYPESALRCDALYALGVTLEEMQEWAQAGKAYDMFLEGCAKSELLNEVRMRKAETILQQGDVQQAAPLFAEVAAVDGFELADHAVMRHAYCLTQLDQLGDAAAAYASLVQRFPQSKFVADATMSAGRCHYRAEQYDESARWFDQVVAAGGAAAVEAAHWRCRIHLRAREPEKALQLADRVLPQAADSAFAANVKLDRADALFELDGRRQDALAAYLDVYQAHRDHDVAALALYNAAFTALDLQAYDQAQQLASEFLQRFADNTLAPDAQYLVAECQMQKKDYAQAESLYRQLLEGTPTHADRSLWLVRRGLATYLQKNYQATIDLLQPATGQLTSPDLTAESLYLIGLSHLQLNQFEQAAAQLQAAMSASATWRQADETMLYLARAQFKLNQPEQAIGTLRALLTNYPGTAAADQVHYRLGEYLYAAERYDEAIAAYQEVIDKHPDSTFVPFALDGKGWAALKAGQYDIATASFATLIDQFPSHALRGPALLARGMCHRQQQRFAEAIADIDAYLKTDPEPSQRADALYERGLAESAQGEFAAAIETLTTLMNQRPDYAGADKVLYELGWAYRSLPDEPKAVEAFATLSAKHPESPLAAEASFHVGEDYYAKKQYADAAKCYEQAAQANNPSLMEKIHYKLGWAYYQQQQYRPALDQFQAQLAAHADGPLAADAWFMKGECLFRLQDYQQALPALTQAIQRPASSPQIAVLRQLHAGQAALQIDKPSESIAFFDAVIKEYPESAYLAEAYFERGRARQQLNQLDQAAADFGQAAERSREAVGARARFMLGELKFQQKQHEEAIKDFQRVMFRFGSEQVPADVKTWQAKAGFEAGRCSEVLAQSAGSATDRAARLADAQKFYRYVIDSHADNEMAAEARKRLEALSKP